MSLVPINPLNDILTGSVWDKFKELIEPYALVNAMIFIVLNLVLVYPATGNSETDSFIGLFTNTTALDAGNLDVWSLVVGTILVFIFSYIINHLSAFFLDFASGEIYRNSPIIGKHLEAQQVNRYKKLKKEAEKNISESSTSHEKDRFIRDKAAFRLAYEFPLYEPELGLTRLGNMLLNPASYIKHQYGASMQLVWPFIQERLLDDNKRLKTVQGNWISLQFFTSLSGLLVFIAMELMVVARLGVNQVLQIFALLAFAGLSYYVSLEKARQWGRGMRRIFDSHIKEVFIDLGMEALKDLTPASADFRSNWQDVMGWLAYGAIPKFDYQPQKTWYKAESPPETWPKLKHPDFLNAQTFPRFTNRATVSQKGDGVYISYNYLFTITNTSTGENPLSGKDAFLLIQDDGVAVPDEVKGHLSRVNHSDTSLAFAQLEVVGQRQPGKPDGLLFPLGEVPPGFSRILTYAIDSRIAAVTSSIDMEKIELKKSERATEEFIDIYPKNLTRSLDAELKIEMLDDTHSALNSRAELIPPPSRLEQYCKGTMSEDLRMGAWLITLKPGKTMIRFRLGG